jgi:membrane fusion protein (multidrug efflux system)
LFAALISGAFGCKKAPVPAASAPTVQVMQVQTTNVAASAEFIGQLDSPQNVDVRARVEAFVDRMLFTEGTEITQGQPLFLLDDKPYQARLSSASGMLAEANAALNKYQKDVARLTPLAAKRAVPQQDLDNALASVDVGKASIISAQAKVEAAQLDLGYCDIRAPSSGLIGARQVAIGDLVGKGSPTLLCTISTLDPIWFYCNVSEVDFIKAQTQSEHTGKKLADLPVSLILANGTKHRDKGRIVFIDRAVDTKTGTLRVRAEFRNAQRLLRPGMFGRIDVDLGARPGGILIPERAITELQGKNFVWSVSPENKATQRAVKIGDQVGPDLVVLEGLNAGDRVIVEGGQKAREGALVSPVTADKPSQSALPVTAAVESPRD